MPPWANPARAGWLGEPRVQPTSAGLARMRNRLLENPAQLDRGALMTAYASEHPGITPGQGCLLLLMSLDIELLESRTLEGDIPHQALVAEDEGHDVFLQIRRIERAAGAHCGHGHR